MKTWLVTGGCGFIGSHLVDRCIAQGDRVLVLDDLSNGRMENLPPQAELVKGDVCDADTVRSVMRNVDGCFHLAAIPSVERSNEDWIDTHRVNLTGTITVFDAARRARPDHPVRVVYASSAAVYGGCEQIPLREDAPTLPLTAYGADKLGSELHGRVASIVHKVPNVGLRFFNVFGPRQDPNSPYSGVIAIFARVILEGGAPTIFGDGRQLRDFIYVGDVVELLLAAMSKEAARCEVVNACTGIGTTVEQLARLIFEACGIAPNLCYGPARLGDIQRSLGDTTKMGRLFGRTPQTPLIEGMRRTIEYIRASRPVG